ncbi:MAG: glutathione-disulfide reductase [Zymomonas mobilis subsp. pomaceae]|uniref:Pyridine nucleotide-disulfide oxidoreductase dimerization region n=1 Tax=Zymomonas mobilis subsp. pomaceae (strain ATCC 29192 / DSM 22645 / JCM 10191 / CCUG 17912 / NBRC 13757 / NCIMB 11200 / NRRL B-4491 / Barker I) TaxID=579138 RepID=F8ETB0_ZYMMT|nr:glutathione-disulfide reductase [Zymomonas mobilis]AEI37000.1 pyridine nucleotide-disulfide oxidoreductase dimerization region [Zymomonas mobilis subsp. pomaceae ATCC 29192]MDX5948372.1 glutathione-disulfide reductase [Zymomonas mobilis subsp. pomaceae]GEB89638.1 glutathione-disulfide reductase [Zymomonas mobilis subsp. pomaceae]
MTTYDVDLFVIGAGSGGVRASRVAASYGASVAIAEEYRVGGTCVIRGCVPKKMLYYAADFASDVAKADRLGWQFTDKKFDWPHLRDVILSDVQRLEGLYTQTLNNNNIKIYQERAVIEGPHQIGLASGKKIKARHILVAVGAEPARLDIPGAELAVTSNEMFLLPELPKRAVVIGGGYIANEFAGILNSFGVKTVVATHGDIILRGYEQEMAQRLVEIGQAHGIHYQFNAALSSIVRENDGSLTATFSNGTKIETDLVLFAIGRIPNSKNLGLEAAHVALDKKGGIIVNEENHSSCSSIYAVGDVTDRVQLTPVAIREGQAFADRVFGNKKASVDYTTIPTAVFSHPPLASAGLTEEEARAEYKNIKIYKSSFRPMRNALIGSDDRALYKMIVDGHSDRVLGLHLIGPDSPEIVQLAAVAIKAGLTKQDFNDTIALHPTSAEELVLLR